MYPCVPFRAVVSGCRITLALGFGGKAFQLSVRNPKYIIRANIMGASGDGWVPRPLVVCGPSGAGKSTLIKNLMEDFNGLIGFSVSHTTRSPRPGETNGVEYHFVSVEEMEESVNRGEFIETAIFAANRYGTSKAAVHSVLSCGKLCLLDIDIQGAKQLKLVADEFVPPPAFVFISPPSLETLEKRLRSRGTDSDDAIERRLAVARAEMDYGTEPGNFDLLVVNDDLETAYEEFKEFVFTLLPQ
ncbi:unnamed protein product [Notodromas monacha]|uniref:guanylate kinase n=1 Tax=Notodromas monacha TaxID=399045 RepID=A0A7R9GFV8_9CRUS|nr:unnamed protein product [Notodromas monacha]CAG0919552.1 unnamed protein product [Notodromas monacha]